MKKAQTNEHDSTEAKAGTAPELRAIEQLFAEYFASLGTDDRSDPARLKASKRLLVEVALGRLPVDAAARELRLPDGGYVLQMMRDALLSFPHFSPELARDQLDTVRGALNECLVRNTNSGLPAASTERQPRYVADDGPLTASQMQQVRALIPQECKTSVSSSLFDSAPK